MTDDGADPFTVAAVTLLTEPPSDFIAARTALVRALRDGGDRELARRLGALPRPTAAAHLVNLLARERPEVVDRLLRVGAELRSAQAAGDGPAIRSLGAERRRAVVEAATAAVGLAGREPGSGVQEELLRTLGAAVVDERSARLVQAGTLVRALPAEGLAGEQAGQYGVVPGAEEQLPVPTPPGRPEDPRATERAEAESALAAALAEVQAAEAGLRGAAAAATEADDAARRADRTASTLRDEMETLRRRLADAERSASDAEEASVKARRARRAAQSNLDDAAESVAAARRRRERLR